MTGSRLVTRSELTAGLAFGAWFIGWAALYSWLVTSDYVGGESFPVEWRRNLAAEAMGVSEEPFMALAFLVPFLLVLAWCSLERILRLDPRGLAGSSLVWTLRNGILPSLVVSAIAWALDDLLLPHRIYWWALPSSLFMGLVPFSILRAEIVSSNRAKRWWRPTWPGLLPIVSVATLWTAVQIGGWLVSLIPTEMGLGIKIPIWVLGLAVALIYPLAQAVVLIYRMNPLVA
jgi:hypothetical protein